MCLLLLRIGDGGWRGFRMTWPGVLYLDSDAYYASTKQVLTVFPMAIRCSFLIILHHFLLISHCMINVCNLWRGNTYCILQQHTGYWQNSYTGLWSHTGADNMRGISVLDKLKPLDTRLDWIISTNCVFSVYNIFQFYLFSVEYKLFLCTGITSVQYVNPMLKCCFFRLNCLTVTGFMRKKSLKWK